MLMIMIAFISIAPYLTDKGRHIKIDDVHVKTSKII